MIGWATVIFVPVVWVSVKAGQGGGKLKPEITEADALAAGYRPENVRSVPPGRGDDKYWALGMFYHNPDDPALLVEDRFGTNIGLNYSKTGVKIAVAVFVLAIIAMYVWLTPILLAVK